MNATVIDGLLVVQGATYSREFASILKREFPKSKTGLKWDPAAQTFSLSTKFEARLRAMFSMTPAADESLAGTKAMKIRAIDIVRNPDQMMTFLIGTGQQGDEVLVTEQVLRDYERDSGMIRISRMSHYAALGIEQTDDEAAIAKAYKAMARRVHPDLNKLAAWAVKSTQLLNESYAILSNPMKRARYNVGLQMARVTLDEHVYTPYCTSGVMGIAYTLLGDGTRKAVKILEWLAN